MHACVHRWANVCQGVINPVSRRVCAIAGPANPAELYQCMCNMRAHPHRSIRAAATGRNSGQRCYAAAATMLPALPPLRLMPRPVAMFAMRLLLRDAALPPAVLPRRPLNKYPPIFTNSYLLMQQRPACFARVHLRSSAAAFIFERVHLRSSAAAPVWGTWPAVRALGLGERRASAWCTVLVAILVQRGEYETFTGSFRCASWKASFQNLLLDFVNTSAIPSIGWRHNALAFADIHK